MRPVLVVLTLLTLALGFSLDTFSLEQAEERIFDGDDRLAPVFVATLAAATLSQLLFGGLIATDTTTATTTTTSTTTAGPATTTTATATTTVGTSTTTAAAQAVCRCGVEGTGRRIVGGTEISPINKYPWLVRLYNKPTSDGNSFCGGTLIASKYVISAAHCMFEYDNSGVATATTTADLIAIRIGDHNLDLDGETSLTPKFVNVVKITNHPDYNQQIGQVSVINDGHDITVLELEEELDLNTYTPACLAKTTDSTTFDGKTATVAGWGHIADGGPFPDPFVPHEVDIPVIASADCKWSSSVPSIICAGLAEGGKDACQSDSGGPLTYKSGDQHVLIGDVSGGTGCALPNEPGFYCRISEVRGWIDTIMSGATFCANGGADIARYRKNKRRNKDKKRKKNKKNRRVQK